ncbi:uncharacterized protein [Eurosta solidaginis]|uniref:uncharacterized protein n=1 Tax=Eurosta solidaginis TaxID=178769 RepID=UPI003530E10A
MGIRVIYRTDVYNHGNGPENFAALINNQGASPPLTASLTSPPVPPTNGETTPSTFGGSSGVNSNVPRDSGGGSVAAGAADRIQPPPAPSYVKPRKSERGDSFPKLRLSPKSFRFSGRFGRSKSEIERCPNDPFYNYSKSFQQYDCTSAVGASHNATPIGAAGIGGVGCAFGGNATPAITGPLSAGGGPQGAVDKPFLLQDGRVGLRASLDKAWYTHGEDVCVTVNIKNDSRKTVRKVRVCAIQHVDVCMFNNGKFKNIVADSDTNSPVDRTVPPGGTLNTTIVLKPARGQTKNWIALEDMLQRSTEPEEIHGVIAASAIRSPNVILAPGQALNPCPSPAVGIPQPTGYHGHGVSGVMGDDRNVFAIYVSYYVKVKLTLSSMGGELSLKLPFVLVHIEEPSKLGHKVEKLALDDVPAGKKNGNKSKCATSAGVSGAPPHKGGNGRVYTQQLDRIESVDDDIRMPIPESATSSTNALHTGNNTKRKLIRSETLAKDLSEEIEEQSDAEVSKPTLLTATDSMRSEGVELEQVHVVQIHSQVTIDKDADANVVNTNETEQIALSASVDSENTKAESGAHSEQHARDEKSSAEAIIEVESPEALQSSKQTPNVGVESSHMPDV